MTRRPSRRQPTAWRGPSPLQPALPAPVRRLLRGARAALGALLPCPSCKVRAAGALGACVTCRRRALSPGMAGQRLWLGAYDGPLARLVRALKYRGVTALAGWLGSCLGAEVGHAGWRPDLVCAVPLHAGRRRERGFNQAELLAREAARRLGVPYRPLLRRTRPTPRQARLDRASRRPNVRGAFASRPLAGSTVLLVDDVLTTGATVEACRDALVEAGAAEVWIAVVARTLRKPPAPAPAQRSELRRRRPAPS